jgi:hypothetical protein
MRLPTAPFAAVAPCKICRNPAPLFGVVDFNKCCEEARGLKLPISGHAIYYRRCSGCGFLYTDFLDRWTQAEFAQHIYNADYAKVDPDCLEQRPARNARLIAQLFGPHRAMLSVLDFGGGNGRFAEHLRGLGFLACDTYDPFTLGLDAPPTRTYNLVTCFETLEHSPDPMSCVQAITASLDTDGLVVFSTLVQPDDFEKLGLTWWYVGPRNGHVSIYSARSLALLWRSQGYFCGSFSKGLHAAFRKLPSFATEAVRINPG